MEYPHPVTAFNFIVSVALFLYPLYLVFWGRREVRGMMIIFTLAGLWSFGVHLLVMIDQTCYDLFVWQFSTTYLIRPLLLVLQSAVLAAVIKSGWRYDD